jgi:oligoribonuclease (3'-5' exoribonuclease)
MKYVSLDIETTGLDSKEHQVLMIAAVLEDTSKNTPIDELEHFTCYVKHPKYIGSAYALSLNSKILANIAAPKNDIPIYSYDMAIFHLERFLRWSFEDKKAVIAGKNVMGFDLQFLPEIKSLVSHRVLDPGPLYTDVTIDTYPPDLKTCLQRAGIDKPVAHDAYEDAKDVIRVLRHKLNK